MAHEEAGALRVTKVSRSQAAEEEWEAGLVGQLPIHPVPWAQGLAAVRRA